MNDRPAAPSPGASDLNPDPLYTVAQAADYLNISQRAVYRAIHSTGADRLPVVRIGARNVRIRRSTLDDYIRTGEVAR